MKNNLSIIELVMLSKFVNSKSEIRRLINGNAIKINNQVITDDKFLIEQSLFIDSYLKLSVGKKKHLRVELN